MNYKLRIAIENRLFKIIREGDKNISYYISFNLAIVFLTIDISINEHSVIIDIQLLWARLLKDSRIILKLFIM